MRRSVRSLRSTIGWRRCSGARWSACARLERERDLAGLSFPADRFELAINDRRVSVAADGGELAQALERLAALALRRRAAAHRGDAAATAAHGSRAIGASGSLGEASRAAGAARRRRRGEGVDERRGRASFPGKVWIVGAGPGDPELLTVRAARLIAAGRRPGGRRAGGAGDLPRRPGSRDLRRQARRSAASVPATDRGDPGAARARGPRVVRLKGGDPSLFARLAEEVRALETAGVAYEIVPGVSSLLAVPLAAGIPLTDRDAADRVVVTYRSSRRRGGRRAGARAAALRRSHHLRGVHGASAGSTASSATAIDSAFPPDLPAVVVSKASLPGRALGRGAAPSPSSRARRRPRSRRRRRS